MRLGVAGVLMSIVLVACAATPHRDVARSAALAATGQGQINATINPPRFGDSDPYDWGRRRPGSYAVHGIDVSRWQGDIDWRTARRAGVSFAFLKATEGGDHVDPKFHSQWRAARRSGVPRGAYHYFYFCRPAAEQARWFIRNVPKEASALPHVLDMEWTPRSKTCRHRPSPRKVRAEAREFLNILERHYGQRPVVYTTPDFFKDTGIGTLNRTEFWLRSVAGHPSKTYPGQNWAFWQYTGTGRVPGIAGDVDINVFRGGASAWRQWLSRRTTR